jgi:hypothetical protein
VLFSFAAVEYEFQDAAGWQGVVATVVFDAVYELGWAVVYAGYFGHRG